MTVKYAPFPTLHGLSPSASSSSSSPAHIYLAAFLAAGTVLLVLLGVAFCYRQHTRRRRARLAAEIRAQLPPKMPPVPDIVEEADLDTPAPGPESMHRPPAMISTNQVCVRRKVWLPYTPILQDELRLFEGEWVTVLEYFDGHWARGRNALGHEGHFPVYCLEPEAQIDI
ncbi:hypothetical protein AMAG_16172 [Allomyces macrogynus ATCC 38327]|uniref:SH3 domain-containing protein n=1 Tax=Allomyces macrogynus (strain ATCC 38327) TaxID=578462 RepID=A0A0L0TA82_ALLM3|nr:hypothetical protein AMAG_16172 [Allomyces macrogynus ATCC 38327]|eukprot:KNE71610.1 hypothetical protein AMAG_16172 [Allomyces macrogynus ATCC 38327]